MSVWSGMDCIDVTNYDRFRARFFANTRRTVRGCFTAALSCGATGFSSLALCILEVLASAVSRFIFDRKGGGLNIFQDGFEVVVPQAGIEPATYRLEGGRSIR